MTSRFFLKLHILRKVPGRRGTSVHNAGLFYRLLNSTQDYQVKLFTCVY
ncbi:hypothetical protein ABIE50_004745 [Chitinophaga sp. OAE865]